MGPTTGHSLYTLLAYRAYHEWVTRNVFAFDSMRPSARIVLERACVHAQDFLLLTAVISETWNFCSTPRASRRVFILWEPSLSKFYKINFDGSVMDNHGGAGFIIHDPGLNLAAAGGCYLFASTVPAVELRDSWTGILYAEFYSGAPHSWGWLCDCYLLDSGGSED